MRGQETLAMVARETEGFSHPHEGSGGPQRAALLVQADEPKPGL
jgi:hypothetical protein